MVFSDQANENELKFAKEAGFFDGSPIIRWLIGCAFTLCLFAFLHFREERLDVLEIHTPAQNFVVAQTDFDYFDEKQTIINKQDAVRDIGNIFEISSKDTREVRAHFEEQLVRRAEWYTSHEPPSFEKVFKAADLIERQLFQIKLTDPRTFQKMEQYGIHLEETLIYSPKDPQIPQKLPPFLWSFIKAKVLEGEGVDAEAVNTAVNFFETQEYMLVPNPDGERAIRKGIQAQIPDRYSRVKAGNRIIDQGEIVNSSHMAKMLAMKAALRNQRNLWHPLTLFGSLILTLLAVGIFIVYFRTTQPQVLYSNRKLLLITTTIALTLGFAKMTELFLIHSRTNWIEAIRYPIFVPFAAIMIASLINANVAIFISGFLTIILAVTLAFERQGFMVMNLAAAFVAILSTKTLRRRKEVFVVCFKGWLCAVAVILSIQFYQGHFWGEGAFADMISSAVFLLITAVLVIGLLPLFESGFKIMTDATLMEYMDPNNDLLRSLAIEAPGTYQHSVVVGNLAESAAMAIGANGLFCRVATLYHDIGKTRTPQYFSENQNNGVNIHQLLTPKESAEVILAHVPEGVALARKGGCPSSLSM